MSLIAPAAGAKAAALLFRPESQPRINTDKHGSSRWQAKTPRRQDTKAGTEFKAPSGYCSFAIRGPLFPATAQEQCHTRCAGPRSRFGLGLWRAARARSLPLGVLEAAARTSVTPSGAHGKSGRREARPVSTASRPRLLTNARCAGSLHRRAFRRTHEVAAGFVQRPAEE